MDFLSYPLKKGNEDNSPEEMSYFPYLTIEKNIFSDAPLITQKSSDSVAFHGMASPIQTRRLMRDDALSSLSYAFDRGLSLMEQHNSFNLYEDGLSEHKSQFSSAEIDPIMLKEESNLQLHQQRNGQFQCVEEERFHLEYEIQSLLVNPPQSKAPQQMHLRPHYVREMSHTGASQVNVFSTPPRGQQQDFNQNPSHNYNNYYHQQKPALTRQEQVFAPYQQQQQQQFSQSSEVQFQRSFPPRPPPPQRPLYGPKSHNYHQNHFQGQHELFSGAQGYPEIIRANSAGSSSVAENAYNGPIYQVCAF